MILTVIVRCCCRRLDNEMQVKVADFGLSRDIYERDYYSSDNRKSKLPVKWMALESLEKGIYNSKTDVVRVTRLLLLNCPSPATTQAVSLVCLLQ